MYGQYYCVIVCTVICANIYVLCHVTSCSLFECWKLSMRLLEEKRATECESMVDIFQNSSRHIFYRNCCKSLFHL